MHVTTAQKPPVRSRRMVAWGIVMMVVGVVAAAVVFAVIVAQVVNVIETLSTADGGGTYRTPAAFQVQLGRGTWELYEQVPHASIFGTSTADIPSDQVHVRAVGGLALAVSGQSQVAHVQLRTVHTQATFVPVAGFTTPSAGRYLVDVQTTTTHQVVVAHALVASTNALESLGAVAGLAVAVAGLVLTIVGSRRRPAFAARPMPGPLWASAPGGPLPVGPPPVGPPPSGPPTSGPPAPGSTGSWPPPRSAPVDIPGRDASDGSGRSPSPGPVSWPDPRPPDSHEGPAS